MLQTFLSRSKFQYGVPALDNMLKIKGMTGTSANSSFLIHDEQILKILIAGKISGDTANSTLKFIKKKKEEKVLQVQEEFRKGFGEYLTIEEHKTKEEADEIVDDIFRIIRDSGSYLFCCAHSYAVSLDSAYCAWLKVYYTYELYATILKLYTEKGNQDKVVKIIDEMKRYKNIRLIPGRFGQDNRDWYIDKEHQTISQSLASVKFISQPAVDALNECKDMHFDTFVDFLRYAQMNTPIKKNQFEVLIKIGYFEAFGTRPTLLKLLEEYLEGGEMKCKITKTTKSWEARLQKLREYESNLQMEDWDINNIVVTEYELMGISLSTDKNAKTNVYLINEVDDQYGIKLSLYNLQRGTRGKVRMTKKLYADKVPQQGQIIQLTNCKKQPRCTYKEGKRIPIQGEFEWWLYNYDLIS